MKKIIAVFAILLFVPSVSFAADLTSTQVQSILSLLSAFGADSATIANVQAALNGQPVSSSSGTTTSSPSCISLTYDLYPGATDATTNGQVSQLQQFLGVITTGYFGPMTLQAVQNWQSSNGIVSSGSPDTNGYGFVGPKTRAALAQGCSNNSNNQISTNTQPTTNVPPTVAYANSCNGTQYPACMGNYHFTCPSSGAGYCVANTTTNSTSPIYGCMNSSATNYNSAATSQWGVTCTYPTTNTNSPSSLNNSWVDIKADGSNGPITMSYGGQVVTISWTSGGVLSCSIPGVPSVNTSGSMTKNFSAPQNTVTIQCTALVNNVVTPDAVSDSVVINVTNIPSGALSVSMFSFVNQFVTPGSQNALIGEFTLAAGSTEGVNINTIGIDAPSSWSSDLQNLKLMNIGNTQQLGTTISIPNSNNNFSMGSNLTIPKSDSVTVGVYANILSTATGGPYQLAVDAANTSGTGTINNDTETLASTVQLQAITPGSPSLPATLGASNPVAANVVAGSSNLEVADYTFSANISSYTVKKLELTIPSTNAAAVSNVSIQYRDTNGNSQTSSAALTTSGATSKALFSGLTFYVPANNSADVSVWVSTPTITTGATTISGTPIYFSLVGTDGTNVEIQDASGNVGYSINNGTSIASNTSGYGFLVLRKSVPTFAGQSNSTTAAPNNSTVLYQFTVSADPAGAVDFDKFSFNIGVSGMSASGFQLFDAANPSIALNATGVNGNGLVSITPDNIVQIPAGGSKTFYLKATIGGWTTGSSLSVNLAPADTTLIANTAAGSISGNYVWSDRSANNDSTSATQWTNGYLLRDLTDGTYSFTHS